MKKTLGLLIIALILLLSKSCGNVVKTTFTNHIFYIFISDDNIKEKEYLLVKDARESLIKYTYQYKPNNDRNIEFTYLKKTNTLNFGPNTFEETEDKVFKVDALPEIEFKKFNSKSTATDVTEPILFNEQYGILAIGNVFAPTIIILPYKSDVKTAREIFNKTLKNYVRN